MSTERKVIDYAAMESERQRERLREERKSWDSNTDNSQVLSEGKVVEETVEEPREQLQGMMSPEPGSERESKEIKRHMRDQHLGQPKLMNFVQHN